MTLTTQPLKPHFGAEIVGVSLAEAIDAATQSQIRTLWHQHQILLFRDQQLEETDLVRFSADLGPLEIHLRTEYLSPDNPEILFISNIRENGRPIGILSDNEVGWHYDQIYLPRPAVGSCLYSVILPESGGSTSFADMSAAYEQLPDEMKHRLEGKRAVQSYEAFNKAYSVPTSKEQKKKSQDIDHPIVRTHPYTGRKALYMCPGMTIQILGMSDAESAETLEFLFDWTVREEFVYTHEWRLGDAILWDNASTMHRREPFNAGEQRLMKRTTILPQADRAVPV